ncbi:MAG: PH domain-containing protein [Candidatus Saccharibacteria bacterium]|nr:PH domain-containing protein [Candidatus Saccharibacteria bacterium]
MVKQDFQGQQPGEEVEFIYRRHRSVMTRKLALAIILVAIGLLPLILNWTTKIGWEACLIALLSCVVVAAYLTFNAWLQWYYTIYIVTNQRVRQQLQKGLFRKAVFDLDLNKVQNIRYNIKGLAGSLAGYGTIVLQTMAGDLVMTKIDQCEEIYGQLAAAVRRAGGQPTQERYDQDDEQDY